MAKKREIAELPTRLLVVAIGGERRQRNVLIGAGIGVVALAVGVFAVTRAVDARETAARADAWSGLNACLLGEPLKPGEAAADRYASLQLSVVGVAKERRAKAGELAWPASCASLAATLGEHGGTPALTEAANALGKALREDVSATGDHRALVERVWAEAATAKVAPGTAPSGAPAAPKPGPILYAGEAFRGLPRFLSGNFLLTSVHEEPSPGAAKIRFLIDQKDMPEGPVICTATATEPTVRCMKVPAAAATLSPGLRLVGTTDDGARPFYFAGDRGQMGVFPPEGKAAIAAGVTLGAVARSDGSLVTLSRKDGARELRFGHQPAVGPTTDRALLQPTDFESAGQTGIFWDWLAYKGAAKAGAKSHLFVRRLGEGSADPKPAVDVGEIEEPTPPDKADKEPLISACRSDEALALRVRGQKADAITFYAGGRWSAPMKAPTRGGALTCRGLEAVTTSIDHAVEGDKDYATITQARCNSSGCTPVSVTVRQMLAGVGEIAPADASSIVAADVGGKLLVVWNAGTVGGLRMRLAAPERLKDADDTVISDGRDGKEAKIGSFAGMRVLSTSAFALLFVNTTTGVKLFRVDPTGQVTALQSAI